MKVLFYTSFRVSPESGGTERITTTVATALSSLYGYKCYSAYGIEIYDTAKALCFNEEKYINPRKNKELIRDYIVKNGIDIFINQGDFSIIETCRYIRTKTKCKVIFVHHFAPGWEVNFDGWKEQWTKLTRKKRYMSLKTILKFFIFPFKYIISIQVLPIKYKKAYLNSNKIVLLSQKFIEPYSKYASLKNRDKFECIPNALSFKYFASNEEIQNKPTKVLLVSRMDECQKRISLAIKIWQRVKKDPRTKGWTFDIIGDGPYREYYEDYICRQNIPSIKIWGRANSESFFKDASIFIMTSKSEGWGLTLTESLQYGVVPIAFNTYQSLSDIIDNDINGIVIQENNIDLYVSSLIELMTNKEKRCRLALNGVEKSKEFLIETICEKWNNMLMSLE